MQGINAKCTKGTINSLSGFQDDLRLYQIIVPVQPGNSEGPLLDINGNITGAIVAVLKAENAFNVTGSLPQNVNYAIKSTYAQELLGRLPGLPEKLPTPSYKQQSFENIATRVGESTVMVITYE